MGDIKIHTDTENDSLNTEFCLLDSDGLSQNVNNPSHCFNLTLDSVLRYGTEIEHLTVFPENRHLFDHLLLTFNLQ